MSDGLKVGIIGAGRMAYWHLRGYQKIKRVDNVGIAGRTGTNVETLQRKFNIPNGYTDYRVMLEKQRPDAINVTTPTYTHCPIVIDGLTSGCHVLCEKPMAMTMEEAERMIKTENSTGGVLMIGFSQGVGRLIGPRVFQWENSVLCNRQAFDRTHAFYEKYGGITIVVARFMPFLRTFAPFVAGVAQMTRGNFTFYDVTGGTLWVASIVTAGYLFGNVGWVQANLSKIIWALIFVPGLIALYGGWRARQSAAS